MAWRSGHSLFGRAPTGGHSKASQLHPTHGVRLYGAAQESTLPSRGLHDRTGFEDFRRNRLYAGKTLSSHGVRASLRAGPCRYRRPSTPRAVWLARLQRIFTRGLSWLTSAARPAERARLVGEHDRLHAVAEAELAEDVREWVLTVASLRKSAAAISAFERPRATSSSTSSSRSVSSASSGGAPRPGRRAADELLDQAAGDRGGEQRVAGGDDADGLGELLGPDVLEQEAAGAGLHRLVDVLVEVERRQDQDARSRRRVRQRAGASPRARRARACGCP